MRASHVFDSPRRGCAAPTQLAADGAVIGGGRQRPRSVSARCARPAVGLLAGASGRCAGGAVVVRARSAPAGRSRRRRRSSSHRAASRRPSYAGAAVVGAPAHGGTSPGCASRHSAFRRCRAASCCSHCTVRQYSLHVGGAPGGALAASRALVPPTRRSRIPWLRRRSKRRRRRRQARRWARRVGHIARAGRRLLPRREEPAPKRVGVGDVHRRIVSSELHDAHRRVRGVLGRLRRVRRQERSAA